MALVETEALVLKSYSLAEADKIVVLLTRTEGLVRGVARGAKRLKSRFGGSLEMFSVVQITYFQKEERELVSIRNVELLKSYFEKAGDPQFLNYFAYLVELLVEFAQPHDPNERLYRMTTICLEIAADNPESLEGMIVYFEVWILKLGGFLPDWSSCRNCKKQLDPIEKTILQSNFQLSCQTCRKSRADQLISSRQRQVFNAAQLVSPSKFADFIKNQDEDTKIVSNILRLIISSVIGKEIFEKKKIAAKHL